MRSPHKALVPMLFALLVLASGAALAETQRLKTQPAILDRVRAGGVFTPNGDCSGDKAEIRFRLTKPETVSILIGRPEEDPAYESGEERVVRTLVDERWLGTYNWFTFYWDGLTDEGEPAATGPYKVRVHLHERDRVLEIGGRIRLQRSTYDPGPNCDKPRRYPPARDEEEQR